MASPRGVAHLSRDLLTKLVATLTDEHLAPQQKLDTATVTVDRAIRDAESPASDRRSVIVAALDDALAVATEQRRAGAPRAQIEDRVRGKLVAELAELAGITVEGRMR